MTATQHRMASPSCRRTMPACQSSARRCRVISAGRFWLRRRPANRFRPRRLPHPIQPSAKRSSAALQETEAARTALAVLIERGEFAG